MRILIFHGYLLRGTGSNIYNASLVRALAGLGHEVDLLCQDRGWDAPEGVTIHNPDIGRVLPVYVADSYDGFDAKPYAELSDAELDHYLDSNVAAVQDAPTPDVALANHLVMGPAILARGLAGRAPFAAKVHGSALEYTVRPHRERFLPYALEGVRGAEAVLVGSRHTAESLWEVVDEPGLRERTRLGPPGVDVHTFRPGVADLERLAGRLDAADAAAWGGEAGAAEALRSLDPRTRPDRQLRGQADRLEGRRPAARRLAAGGGARAGGAPGGGRLRHLPRGAGALRRRDGESRRGRAARDRRPRPRARGRAARGAAVPGRLPGGAGQDWLAAAPAAAERIHFTGRLEHEDLPDLLPACEAQVMPSTFPEAFGMVAAEAAACGALPLSANHSGMAEVTATLAPALPEALRPLLSFDVGPGAVEEIAAKLIAWLTLDPAERERARAALAAEAAGRYSWESVAEGVIAAAQGRLDALPHPAPPPDMVPAR